MVSDALLSPLTWLCVALIPLLTLQRNRRRARGVAWGALLLSGLLCTPLGANGLLWMVERDPAVPTCATDQARWPIVLLSGGFDHPPTDARSVDALTTETLERAMHALLLAQENPEVAVVISGGGPYAVREADVIAELMRSRGVLLERLKLERDSRTTWESAERLSQLTHVRLVTSPLHMPRAAQAFRTQGIAVCAAATRSDVIRPRGPIALWPRSTAIIKSEGALHELAGYVTYSWRGHRNTAAG